MVFHSLRIWLFVVAAALTTTTAWTQVSPEEHQKHHPSQAPGSTTAGTGAPGGPGAGMGEMMSGMNGTPAKPFYPSFMTLPELTAEQRSKIEQEAADRLRTGASVMGQALEAMTTAAGVGDYAVMEDATVRFRDGLAQFESGVAACRALKEGRAPQQVALQWFKREMNLLPPPSGESISMRLWGMTPFHAAVMLGLVAFAVAMLGMYALKMKRAANLLQSLAGATASASPAPASPKRGEPVFEPPSAMVSTGDIARPKRWAGKLRVAQIFEETPTVKTFRLMNPLGGSLPFTYLPGQFLTLAVVLNDRLVKRSYTIASSPTQHDFVEITVKHEEPGEVSGYLHSRVQPEDLLEFAGPAGAFNFTGRECKCILLIGGGVGITPLMSVIRYLTDRSWTGDIYLVFSIGQPQEFIFREELEHLERRHANLHVIVTASRPEGSDWNGPRGRISKELLQKSVPDLASRFVHLCGPVPMMEAVKAMLIDLGVPVGRIKTEAFGPVLGKPEPSPEAPSLQGSAAQVNLPTVAFSISNKSGPISPEQTVLEVADQLGVEIDNSCRVGTCGTCRVKLLRGEVTMAVEDGLEPGDKEKSIVLACQAKTTRNLEIEA